MYYANKIDKKCDQIRIYIYNWRNKYILEIKKEKNIISLSQKYTMKVKHSYEKIIDKL